MAAGFWHSLPCRFAELRLDITLACGQSFRWKEIQPGIWRSVLAGKIWTLKQTEHEILYQVYEGVDIKSEPQSQPDLKPKAKKSKTHASQLGSKKSRTQTPPSIQIKEEVKIDKPMHSIKSEDKYKSVLYDYFQLQVNLGTLYNQWRKADSNFQQVAADFPGVRILRQDPTENLFAFICSSNNNISRITSMVEKLCLHYGDKVGTLDGEDWYAFPPVTALANDGVEQHLRELGFGYRAKFINQSAKLICEKDGGWLESLRRASYEEAHKELLQLTGVGAKVADCVCLMSLDKTGAIPVDTHVWQIASRDYMPKLTKTKSLTDKIYKEIGEFFRNLFGDYAGWAHSVLFSADLKKFQDNKSPKPKNKTASKRKSGGGDTVAEAKAKKTTAKKKIKVKKE